MNRDLMCVPSHHISSSGSFSFFIAFERLLAAMQPIYLSTEAVRGRERGRAFPKQLNSAFAHNWQRQVVEVAQSGR